MKSSFVSLSNKFLLFLVVAMSLAACNFRNPQPKYPTGKVGYVYGKAFDYSIYIPATQLPAAIKNRARVDSAINGKVIAISDARDGWFKIDAGNGKTILVEWNHLFDVGKDIVGKNATVYGYAYMDTIKVADLKKEAANEGKPQADIDSISYPEIQLAYKAYGIIAY